MTERIPVYTEKILTYLNHRNIDESFDMNNVTENISANFIESQELNVNRGNHLGLIKKVLMLKESYDTFYVSTEMQTMKTIRLFES